MQLVSCLLYYFPVIRRMQSIVIWQENYSNTIRNLGALELNCCAHYTQLLPWKTFDYKRKAKFPVFSVLVLFLFGLVVLHYFHLSCVVVFTSPNNFRIFSSMSLLFNLRFILRLFLIAIHLLGNR